jgi:hypothetical protein
VRTVSRFCVTPVKGMALQHPSSVDLGPAGISGSRRFYLVDASGELFSAWAFGPLVCVRPAYDLTTERLTLTFPDGRVIDGDAASVGAPVTTDFYGRPVPGRGVAGPFTEALSAFVGKPATLVRCERDGDGVDVHPLSVISNASVRDLARRGGRDQPLDARRFRMNIEIDGCEPYDEDAWRDRRLRVGEAILRVGGPIPRCVLTTQSPETGERDWNTLAQIARYRPRIAGHGGLPFGVYARVEEPGRAAVGDGVELLE